MTDIFDQKILCRECNVQMKPGIIEQRGLQLRAVQCPRCKAQIIHPADLNASEKFNDLRGKTFNVKLRMVGNSHAISIPKEIFEFMNSQHSEMERQMNEMVRLCLKDFNSLSLNFGGGLEAEAEDENEAERDERDEDEDNEEEEESRLEARKNGWRR